MLSRLAAKPVILLLMLILSCMNTDAHRYCGKGSKKSYGCTPEPTTAPSPAPSLVPSSLPSLAPSSQPSPTPIKITFSNETIKLLNLPVVSLDDIDSFFVVQKEWLEEYFRDQDRRWMQRRGLQDRRRDSRDITTEFEFVAQNVTYNEDGKPTNEVTYDQVIGFGPSRRRLIEINTDDIDEVYQVSTKIYRDREALDDLTTELRENITSFSSLEGIEKFAPPSLACGTLCQSIPSGGSRQSSSNIGGNTRQRRLENSTSNQVWR